MLKVATGKQTSSVGFEGRTATTAESVPPRAKEKVTTKVKAKEKARVKEAKEKERQRQNEFQQLKRSLEQWVQLVGEPRQRRPPGLELEYTAALARSASTKKGINTTTT